MAAFKISTQTFRALVVVFLALLCTATALQNAVAKHQQSPVGGTNAELTEEGYQLVAALTSDDEMMSFMTRVLLAEGLEVSEISEESLRNVASSFSGENEESAPVQSFQQLRLSLLNQDWVQWQLAAKKRESTGDKANFSATQVNKEGFTADGEERQELRSAELTGNKATSDAFRQVKSDSKRIEAEAGRKKAETEAKETAEREAQAKAEEEADRARAALAERQEKNRKVRYLVEHQAEWKAKQDWHPGDGESEVAKEEVWAEHLAALAKLERSRQMKETAAHEADMVIEETVRAVKDQQERNAKDVADRTTEEDDIRKAKEAIERFEADQKAKAEEAADRRVEEEIARIGKDKALKRKKKLKTSVKLETKKEVNGKAHKETASAKKTHSKKKDAHVA
jgi:hypothetical protein